MSDKKPKVAVYCRVGNKDQLCETPPAAKEDETMDEFRSCQGVPGEVSMWDALSFVDGYDDVTFAAMELILEKGPDALMYQLNYDNVEVLREEFPTIYKRAIELGILEEKG